MPAATAPRRTPWVAIDVDIRKDDRVVDLPGHTARYGYIAGVLAEARLQTVRGVFGSRATLEEAIGRFAGHADDYIASGLLERSPQLCTECRQRFGQVKTGAIVVHNWHRKQHDPTHAQRQAAYEAKQRTDALADAATDASTDGVPDVEPDGVTDAPTDGEPDGQVTPYSRARAETPDTRHVTPNTDTREGPPAQARARAATPKPPKARPAGASFFSIGPDDERHPVAKLLAQRFKYREVSDPQWDRLFEIVDNEYPIGTSKGADRHAAWRWLAELMRKLPRTAGDPIEAAFTEVNRRITERKSAADADEAAWSETKAAHTEAGPIAADLAAKVGSTHANGHAPKERSRESVIATLAGAWPALNAPARAQMLERYGVDEAAVLAAVPRSIEEAPDA